MKRTSWFRYMLGFVSALFLLSSCSLNSVFASAVTTQTTEPSTGITVAVASSGTYTIIVPSLNWTFGGSIGQTLSNIVAHSGRDNLGNYTEVAFTYAANASRSAGIRTYETKPVILFTDTYLVASTNTSPFPRLTSYPRNLYHLAYSGEFAAYTFTAQGEDSPWTYYDAHNHAFILSPASNFMIASMKQQSDGSITSGINASITMLPQGFTQKTFLVIDKGINSTFETWGHAMTDLQGKIRPASDADPVLNTLGYWTDTGAAYYYKFDPNKGYIGTLLAVKASFQQKDIPLGYMEIDSWWYPKGPVATWQGISTNDRGGIYTYTAAPDLFPNGLTGFEQQLQLPLGTHARWIDPSSPYRQQFHMSNNVSTDPRYWNQIASYLQAGGVITYKQDWLNHNALPGMNLTDPSAFMDTMARAMAAHGITIQYCMPLPRHFLQSSEYNNVTTIRVSGDHFMRARWTSFLYTSRLAGALGIWPWADVFNSTETNNLLLSTLSAGIVGVGDPIGAESKTNLLQSIRADGVIVKPDIPIVPIDAMYVQDAQKANTPMIASTYTDHNGMKASYVFAYTRGQNNSIQFSPSSPGYNGRTYVYNYFTHTGTIVDAGASYNDTIQDASYYIVVPIGPSGIAFLGDTGKFVSLGKKRIAQLSDNGTLQATISFAKGEKSVKLHGYAPSQPTFAMVQGAIDKVTYDSTTHLFTVVVSPAANNAAMITVKE